MNKIIIGSLIATLIACSNTPAGNRDGGSKDKDAASLQDARAVDAGAIIVVDGAAQEDGRVGVAGCPAEAILCVDFEDGELYGANTPRLFPRNIGSGAAQSLSETIRNTGNYALRMTFLNGNNELGFTLGADYEEVYIRFYIYYPSGEEPNEIRYVHRDGPSSDNNKMFRIYGDEYVNNNKMGASQLTSTTGMSRLYLETKRSGDYPAPWTCGGSMGKLRDEADLLEGAPTHTFADSDRGKWMALEFHVKSDDGTGTGAIEMWVDGVKRSGYTNVSIAGAPCKPNYFNEGFLFGPANSGYDASTNIYVDDIVFSTSYIGP